RWGRDPTLWVGETRDPDQQVSLVTSNGIMFEPTFAHNGLAIAFETLQQTYVKLPLGTSTVARKYANATAISDDGLSALVVQFGRSDGGPLHLLTRGESERVVVTSAQWADFTATGLAWSISNGPVHELWFADADGTHARRILQLRHPA